MKITVLGVTIAAASFMAPSASAQGVLNVYCSVQVEWCTLLANEFQKASGIKVSITQKGSGETIAQLKAEAQNPKGDVWFGGTGDPHLQAAEEGLTRPTSRRSSASCIRGRSSRTPIRAARPSASMPARWASASTPSFWPRRTSKAPACWADLLKPEFKGEIQMANPNSSGTGLCRRSPRWCS
jgi:iron(III) transport system substrate-binding protein